MNADLQARYAANRLRVVRQVRYRSARAGIARSLAAGQDSLFSSL